MKALYIIGIVFSIIFLCVTGYYVQEVASARLDALFSSISSYSSPYSTYSSIYDSGIDDEITQEAGWVSLLFFLFFLGMTLGGLLKVKTKTNKIMSIVALCMTGIFLLWDFMMIADPGALSFDEVGGGFMFYTFFILAYSIVGLIHCGIYARKLMAGNAAHAPVQVREEILD